MKSFREFILESDDPLSSEDRKSLDSKTGSYYHGADWQSSRRTIGSPKYYTFVHSETGEEVPRHHEMAKRIGPEQMTDEQKINFARGMHDQIHHSVLPEVDYS